MKVNEFVTKALEYEQRPTLYKLGTYMNRKSGEYLLCDCSGLIKGILWGYPDNGKYASNGAPDTNANNMISKHCSGVTRDMKQLRKGMIVWMPGHVGIYCGDGVVVESSPRWENGIQRTYPVGCPVPNKHHLNQRTWTKCGYLYWVDYSNTADLIQVAKDVIKGKYGNGKERIDNLTKAGYNYKEVQRVVNSLLK